MCFFTYTFFRLPRFWRGILRPRQSLVTRLLAGQFVKGQALASQGRSRFHEPISIGSFASIESETLFIEISEQVKRFDADVSTLDHPLQQTPKVLNSVRVDLSVNVSLRVIDNAVNISVVKAIIRRMLVAVDVRAFFDMLTDSWLQNLSASSRNDHSPDFAAVSFKQAHDSNLPDETCSRQFGSLAFVHIASESADESFVNLDVSRQFAERIVLHCLADSMKQKPRALLSNTKRAMDFVRANAVLCVGDQPDAREPLIKADRRVFHDRPYLDTELFLTGFAFPEATRRKIRQFLARAHRTLNAVRPAHLRKKVYAVISIREVQDRLLQSLWKVTLFRHSERMLAQNGG